MELTVVLAGYAEICSLRHVRLTQPKAACDLHLPRRLLIVSAVVIARGTTHRELTRRNPDVDQSVSFICLRTPIPFGQGRTRRLRSRLRPFRLGTWHDRMRTLSRQHRTPHYHVV